jgi:hypothetical protein
MCTHVCVLHTLELTCVQDGCVSFSPDLPDFHQVYGHTPARQRMLRTLSDGKMKTRIVNGEEMLPLWSDVPNLVMW